MIKQLLTYLFIAFVSITNAQHIEIISSNLSDSISIGKEYTLKLKVSNIINQNYSILDSAFYNKTEAKFNFLYIDSIKGDNTQDIHVNTFDTGYVVIGPFGIVTAKNDTLFTSPLLKYVKYPKINPAKGFKQSLPNVNFELTTKDEIVLFTISYWWIFVFLILIPALVLWAYFISKKRKAIQPEPELPKVSLRDEYLNLLDDINSKQLWQEGKIKQYHTEVTFAIRSYISQRYRIKALEKTSTQIASALRTELFDDELKQKMNFLLTLSDMVKFAKGKPSDEENERIIDIAKEFITLTHKDKEM